MSLRLVNEDGTDVPEGETGEILVKSDGLTIGYWEDPQAYRGRACGMAGSTPAISGVGTRQATIGSLAAARRSSCGEARISLPLEVEAVLSQHPAVHEVGVVGAPHPSLGEIVAAFVVLKDGAAATEKDLRQFAAGRIADYKIPERVTLLADLPRGLTGKVQRKTLREWAAKAHVS